MMNPGNSAGGMRHGMHDSHHGVIKGNTRQNGRGQKVAARLLLNPDFLRQLRHRPRTHT